MHDIEGIIPRLLIVVDSHHHILLGRCLFKQVKEGNVSCVRRRLVVVLSSDGSILWLFEVVYALLGLHFSFEVMSTRMCNRGKLVASPRWWVHKGFDACRRGNGVGGGAAPGIQRHMRLLITLN